MWTAINLIVRPSNEWQEMSHTCPQHPPFYANGHSTWTGAVCEAVSLVGVVSLLLLLLLLGDNAHWVVPSDMGWSTTGPLSDICSAYASLFSSVTRLCLLFNVHCWIQEHGRSQMDSSGIKLKSMSMGISSTVSQFVEHLQELIMSTQLAG